MFLLRIFSVLAAIILLSSCCRDCLITNRELSSLKKYDVGPEKAVRINSGWKYAEFILTGNKGIASYGIDQSNVLGGNYSQYINSTFLRDGDGQGWKNEPFECLENSVIGDNTVMFSNIQNKDKIRDVRKVSMDLDNGLLRLSERVYNDSGFSIGLRQDDNMELKTGGYFLFPLSILSNLGNGRSYQPESSMSEDLISRTIIHDGNWLIVSAEPGVKIDLESNSGWFAYLKDNLLFIKKYSSINDDGKRENKFLKVEVNDRTVSLFSRGFVREISPGQSSVKKQKWNIIEVSPVKTAQDAMRLFKNNEMKLRVLIDRE